MTPPNRRVVIDGRGAAAGGTGIATYVRALVRNLAEMHVDNVRVLCYSAERQAYRRLGGRPWPIPSGRLFRPWQLPRVGVTHGPNFNSLRRRGARSLITVHDLAFLHFPDDYPPAVVTELTHALDRQQWFVDEVLCVSAASERDLLDAYPAFRGRTAVVHLGVDESWFNEPRREDTEQTLASLELSRPFVFHLGAMVPRKDLPTLVKAWLLLRHDRPELGLVLAGPSADAWRSDRAAIAELIAAAPADAQRALRVLGRVDDDTARRLMGAATVYCTTSKLEGFGLPALEAMAARVPVVATRDRAIMEVGGGHVRYAAAGDPEAVCVALGEALDAPESDRLDAARAHARTFTWRACADRTLQSYVRLLDGD